MKCKLTGFVLCIFISFGIMNGSNKIDILSSELENQYTSKFKLPKRKPKRITKKVIKKSKEEQELEYWSNVTGKQVSKVTKINARLSFYTDLECTPYGDKGYLTASGEELRDGIIANNVYPFGTTINFEGFGTYNLLDRGGKGLYGNNFDVYLPRQYGETDSQYRDRALELGRKNVNGWILEFAE